MIYILDFSMKPYVCEDYRYINRGRGVVLDIKLDKLDHCYLLRQLWYRVTYTPSGVPLVRSPFRVTCYFGGGPSALASFMVVVVVNFYLNHFFSETA